MYMENTEGSRITPLALWGNQTKKNSIIPKAGITLHPTPVKPPPLEEFIRDGRRLLHHWELQLFLTAQHPSRLL